MDWYIDAANQQAVRAVREELLAYLFRHAEWEPDLATAEALIEQLLGNVHDCGGLKWISVNWSHRAAQIIVQDLARGFGSGDLRSLDGAGNIVGLAAVGRTMNGQGELEGHRRGTRVTAMLPARRALEPVVEAPLAYGDSHFGLEDGDDGDDGDAFGVQGVLRVLLVNLAQSVEFQQGPAAAEAAVARMGADVGSGLEAQYRRERGIAGPLTPEQLGDLFVRLQRTIDGDARLLEADAGRIVLGMRLWRSQGTLRHGPSLYRLMMSVFSAIVTRNQAGGAIGLQVDAGVGDPEGRPEGRVVIWLRDEPDDEHTLLKCAAGAL
jgi:hypothetical protein